MVPMNGNKAVIATFTSVSPGTLLVTPADGLSASGGQGGPFSPSNKTYTLQNTGGIAINWTASKAQSWFNLSSNSGTLLPGASTTVMVWINSNAHSLGVGSYSDSVVFRNITNGSGDTTRLVVLTVSAQVQYSLTTSVDP